MTQWKLVPVEPTTQMLNAASRVAVRGALKASWDRMLEAAPPPPKLTDERIEELIEEAKANWNAQADQYNQWSDLGVDEVVTFVVRAIEREILGGEYE